MFEEMRQMFADPHARHAILVHMPIVLGSLAFLPIAAALILRLRHKALLAVALAMLVLASGGAAIAAEAGEEASEHLDWESGGLSKADETAIKRHEELGEGGWIWPLIPAGLLGLALLARAKGLQAGAASLALLGSLGVGGWVALTAHRGGQLVYMHGVGVPAPGRGSPVNVLPPDAKGLPTGTSRTRDDD